MTGKYQAVATSPPDPAPLPILETEGELTIAPDERPETLRRAIAEADALIVRVLLPDDTSDYAVRL